MRLMFLGSPEPVVAPLQALIAAAKAEGHEVVGVVSQPARPAGRGQAPLDPPVAAFAKSVGMPTLQPEKASDPEFLAAFAALAPDVAITAAYGQILSEAFLRIPTRGTINIHPSLLPKYRGATPVPAALLAGEEVTGVTVLFTVKKLDAGAIIVQEKLAIARDETAGELTTRAFAGSAPLVFAALKNSPTPITPELRKTSPPSPSAARSINRTAPSTGSGPPPKSTTPSVPTSLGPAPLRNSRASAWPFLK